jgi:hypothetical protein
MHVLRSCSFMTSSRDQNMYSEKIADGKSCRGSVENSIPQNKAHRTAMRRHIRDILTRLLGLLVSPCGPRV